MMKKITLLFVLLTVSFGFSQSLPIDFDDPLDANFVGAGGNTFAVVVDGTDNVGQTVSGADQYNSRVDLALDTYIDMTTANKTFTFDFYTSEAVVMTGLFQINNEASGGFPIEMQFTTDGNIGWQTITLDFNSADNGYPNCSGCPDPQPVVYGQYAALSVFTNFGDFGSSTYWFDDIAGAANGGPVAGDPEPSVAAPAPPARAASDVISLFSGAYTNIGVSEWSTAWDNSDISDVVIDGDDVKKVNFGIFLGIQLTNSIDLSSFTHMHFDYWITDALTGGEVLNPKLSNHAAGAGETSAIIYTNPVTVSGEWVSFDVPLADFTIAGGGSLNRDKINQLLLDCSATLDLIYFDNLYFHKNTTLGTNDFEIAGLNVYPNPTQNSWTVKTQNIKMSSIQVFDILGKQVLSLTPEATEAKIDASTLKSGLYFAKINTANGSSSLKLVRQ